MIQFNSERKTLSLFSYELNLRSSYPYLAALTFLWVCMMALVNPVGEFPFADDWMYARTAFELVTNHRLVLNDFQAVTILSQVVWGALFSIPFGFSMTALRFSVIVLGWFGILGAYGLFRESGAGRLLSFLGAAAFATTPFLVLLSNTFMTDVPFCSMSVISVFFLIRWINHEKLRDFAAGTLLACATILIRPLALAIPIAFSFAYLVRRGISWKTLFFSAGAIGALVVTLMLYETCLKATVGLPVMYVQKKMVFRAIFEFDDALKHKLFMAFFYRLMVVLIYLGNFLLPLILLAAPAQWKRLTKSDRITGAAAAAIYAAGVGNFLWGMKLVMPMGMDQLFDLGLGYEMMDGNTLGYKLFTGHAPLSFWIGVTAAGVAGSSWLMAQAALFVKGFVTDVLKGISPAKHWQSVFCLAIFSIHFIPFGLSGHFDRYQLFYIPFLAFWIVGLSGPADFSEYRKRIPVFAVLTALFAYFSVAATHDCMMRNRVRWTMLRYMMEVRQIPPEKIDGGYEFNGWYTYSKDYQKRPDVNWWWVIDDKYRVSYNPSAEGYTVVAKVNYDRWIPQGQGSIYILERIAEKRPDYKGPVRSVYDM